MEHAFTLNSLLKKHRPTILHVVILSVIESLLFVAQFYFIGSAINDLLQDKWKGIYILIALFIAKTVVSVIKQKRISITYKNIYDQLVIEAIGAPLSQGKNPEALTHKSSFIHLMTNFFKGDLIKGFETIVRLVLVLVALLILNKLIFLVAIIIAMIVFLLYYIRKKKTVLISRNITEELAKEHEVLKTGKTEILFDHHSKLEKLDNNLLGISAFNLSVIEILSFAFLIISMVILVKTDGENALGTFFSMLYYVMAFTETMFLLPSVYQNYLKITEISKKV